MILNQFYFWLTLILLLLGQEELMYIRFIFINIVYLKIMKMFR